MVSILILIMVVSILVFWNIDAHIRKKNRFPTVREIFKLYIRKEDYRAFKFFVYFSVVLLGVFLYSVYTSIKLDKLEWFSLNEILIVFIFVFALMNYVYRLYMASYLYGDSFSNKITHIWNVWSVGIRKCRTKKNKVILIILDVFIIILTVIYFLLTME